MRIGERYELAAELRDRYAAADRRGRSQILDGYCLAAGYHRKYALELLRGRGRKPVGAGRGRRRRYGLEFRQALKVLWEASGYICSRRLQPFLAELAPLLQRHHQLELDPDLEALLLTASISTVERNLAPLRRGLLTRRMSQTKPGSILRHHIPVLVGRWRELDRPGYLEVDLVSHSGELAAGEWIWTLCATDLCTGWSERVAVMGKAQSTITQALARLRRQLPFPLLGIHPDNGSEFINNNMWAYCQEQAIAFTRSRTYHRNDNPHVEQKNWTLVRRLIGYQRLDTPAQLSWLDALYTDLLRPYNNCFQPVMKLIRKEAVGEITRKCYDEPASPLRRLLETGAADPAKIPALIELYATTSPLTLKRLIDRRLAAMPAALETAASA
jgi:hypothetical protein